MWQISSERYITLLAAELYSGNLIQWSPSELPDGIDAGLAPLSFHFGDRVPLKGESPVKTANHRLVCLHVKLKGVPVDGVDDRTHNGAGIVTDPEKKGRRWARMKTRRLVSVWIRNDFIYMQKYQIWVGFPFIQPTYLSSRGSIQPGTHSQWQSRNVKTSPVA